MTITSTSDYQVILKNPAGEAGVILPFISIEYALSLNNPGALTISLSGDHTFSEFPRDSIIEVWRKPLGGSWYLAGRSTWLLRKITYTWNNIADQKWTLTAVSPLDILKRRIVAYRRDDIYSDKTDDNGNDGPADDLMKAYLRENIGSLVLNSERDLSDYVEIEADESLGANAEKQAAWRDLLTIVKELASDSESQGVPIYFDMIGDGQGKYRFRTSINQLGANRTKSGVSPIMFSDRAGNLTDIDLTLDYTNEKTVAYVGGQGSGALREIYVSKSGRESLSPFNRIEVFHDARDMWYDSLPGEGRARLEETRPLVRLEARALDTIDLKYGRDYFFGDRVTVSVEDYVLDCMVQSVDIGVSDGREDVDVRLSGIGFGSEIGSVGPPAPYPFTFIASESMTITDAGSASVA